MTALAAPQPAAPAEIPGVKDGEILGSIGAGGTALVLLTILVLGIRGKKHPLPTTGALIVAFAASIFCVAAGGVWGYPSEVVRPVIARFTSGNSFLGDIGPGALALAVTAILWYVNLSPKWTAIWAYIAAVIYGAAGGIWVVPIETIYTAFSAVGL